MRLKDVRNAFLKKPTLKPRWLALEFIPSDSLVLFHLRKILVAFFFSFCVLFTRPH